MAFFRCRFFIFSLTFFLIPSPPGAPPPLVFFRGFPVSLIIPQLTTADFPSFVLSLSANPPPFLRVASLSWGASAAFGAGSFFPFLVEFFFGVPPLSFLFLREDHSPALERFPPRNRRAFFFFFFFFFYVYPVSYFLGVFSSSFFPRFLKTRRISLTMMEEGLPWQRGALGFFRMFFSFFLVEKRCCFLSLPFFFFCQWSSSGAEWIPGEACPRPPPPFPCGLDPLPGFFFPFCFGTRVFFFPIGLW